MIVGVKPWDASGTYNYFNVPNMHPQSSSDRDKARQIAFRFLRKEKERDYIHLVHTTMIIDPIDIPPDVAVFVGQL